jgi:hypothetical protein
MHGSPAAFVGKKYSIPMLNLAFSNEEVESEIKQCLIMS